MSGDTEGAMKRSDGRADHRTLTARQRRVLDMVTRGMANKTIAKELAITEQAVKEHVSTLLRRFEVSNRASLAEIGTHLAIMGVTDADTSWLPYLFMAAPIGMQVFRGPDHRIVATNAAARKAADRDVIGMSLREGYPLTADRIGPMLDLVFASGEPHVEYEFSGTWVRDGLTQASYSDFVLQPIKGPDGTVTDVVLFGSDVTERVLARRRVERLSAEQLAIFGLVTDGVLVVDGTGRLLKVNDAARRLTGMQESFDLRARDRIALFAIRDVSGRLLDYEELPLIRALAGETVPWTELLAYNPVTMTDYRQRATAAPIHASDGAIIGAVALLRPPLDP
jgi:DNA-binding CsgD family transcriptional regulator